MSNDQHPESLGKVGEYSLIRKIAEGGMGAVYLGEQELTRRKVAVKILPREMVSDGVDSIARFQQEIRTLASLTHPNIVNILGCGETDEGDPWYAMEFIEGMTLQDHIQKSDLTTGHVFDWIPQICDALEFAHHNKIVHRDVKPANILISETGQVKMVDFGLAKHMDAEQTAGFLKTQVGVSLGTPDFISPEQLDTERTVDGRADIYSLGVLLYNFLTSKLPKANWKMPSKVIPGLPKEFDEIVTKSLEEDPEDRFSEVSEFREALLAVPEKAAKREEKESNTSPVAARPRQAVRPARKTSEQSKSKGTAAILALAGLAVLAVGGFMLWKNAGRESSPEASQPPVPVVSEEAAKIDSEATAVAKATPEIPSKPAAIPSQPETPAKAPPSETTDAPGADTVDILKLVDTSLNPNWELENGKLISPECGFGDPDLPTPTEVKGLTIKHDFPERYRLTMKVKTVRENPGGFKIYLPVGGNRNVSVNIGELVKVGIGSVHDTEEEGTIFKNAERPLGANGEINTIILDVAEERFRLVIDGKPWIDWQHQGSSPKLGGVPPGGNSVLAGWNGADMGLFAFCRLDFEEITLHPYADPGPPSEQGEKSGSPGPAGPVDLLSHVDTALNPNWKMEGGALISPKCSFGDDGLPSPDEVKGLPIQYDFPDRYQLRIMLESEHKSGSGMKLYIPLPGARSTAIYLEKEIAAGINDVHRGEEKNDTIASAPQSPLAKSESPILIVVDVGEDELKLNINGKQWINWKKGNSGDQLGGKMTTVPSVLPGGSAGDLGIWAYREYRFQEISLHNFGAALPEPDKKTPEPGPKPKEKLSLTGPLDLLKHVDISLNPNWELKNGELVSPECAYHHQTLPVPETFGGIPIPFELPVSYSLRMRIRPEFDRPSGIRFYLPVGTNRRIETVFDMGGKQLYGWKIKGTRALIGGKALDSTDHPTFDSGGGYVAPHGRSTELTFHVHPDRFSLESEGSNVLHWEESASGEILGEPAVKDVPRIIGPSKSNISLFAQSQYVFESIEILPYQDQPPGPKLDIQKRKVLDASKAAPRLTGPVDLLKHVDLSLNPNWTMEDDVLVSPICSYSKDDDIPSPDEVKGIMIPFSFPPVYELRMEGEMRRDGISGGRIFLPVGLDRATILHFDNGEPKLWNGPGTFATFEGQPKDNETLYTRQPLAEGGRKFEFVIQVKPDKLLFKANNRTIIDWEQKEGQPELGNRSANRKWANIEHDLGRNLGLFMHSSFAFEKITLLPHPAPGETAPAPNSTGNTTRPAPAIIATNPVGLLRAAEGNPLPADVATRFEKLAGPFETAWQKRVTDVYEAAVQRLDQSYLRALNQALTKAATEDVDLDAAKAIREERNGIKEGTFTVPHIDPEGTPERLVALRATYRKQMAAIAKRRDTNGRTLLRALDKQLSTIQDELTQDQKIDEALFVKERRTQLSDLLKGQAVDLPKATPDTRKPKPAEADGAQVGISRPEGGKLVVVPRDSGVVNVVWNKLPDDLSNVSRLVLVGGANGSIIRGNGLLDLFSTEPKSDPSITKAPKDLQNVVATGGESGVHKWRFALQEDGTFHHWGTWGEDAGFPDKFRPIKEIKRSGHLTVHTIRKDGRVEIFGKHKDDPVSSQLKRLRNVKSVRGVEVFSVVLFEDGTVEVIDPDKAHFTDADHAAAKDIDDAVKVVGFETKEPETLVLTKSGKVVPLGWGDDFSIPDFPNDIGDIEIMRFQHADETLLAAAKSRSQGWIFFGRDIDPELAKKYNESTRDCDRISIQHIFIFGIRVDPNE